MAASYRFHPFGFSTSLSFPLHSYISISTPLFGLELDSGVFYMAMEKKQVKLSRAGSGAVAGAVTGSISRTVTSPLDVIKIRFQGFCRGNVPGLLMAMPYTAIQFVVLQKLKTLAAGSSGTEDHSRLSPYLSYISGGLGGFAAQIGSYPFDLLRTILASQGEPKVYPNMRAAFIDIIRTCGIRGLYAGLSPTLVEIVPYAGLQFGTYDTFKCWIMIAELARDPRYGVRVEHRADNNLFDAFKQILQSEGWAGLYKGIVPSTVKAAPAGAVTFVAYEVILNWLDSTFSMEP